MNMKHLPVLLALLPEVEWMLKYANSPRLDFKCKLRSHWTNEWEFVELEDNLMVKRELTKGIWQFNAIKIGPSGMFKGACTRKDGFELTNGEVVHSNDVWSSNSRSINEVFGLKGDDRLAEVSFGGVSAYAITHGAYKAVCGSLGLCVFEERGYISPSLSLEELVKER